MAFVDRTDIRQLTRNDWLAALKLAAIGNVLYYLFLASHWLKDALTSAPDHDPVDVVNDAELLAMVLGHRADQITATARAALDAGDVIKRAQNNGC